MGDWLTVNTGDRAGAVAWKIQQGADAVGAGKAAAVVASTAAIAGGTAVHEQRDHAADRTNRSVRVERVEHAAAAPAPAPQPAGAPATVPKADSAPAAPAEPRNEPAEEFAPAPAAAPEPAPAPRPASSAEFGGPGGGGAAAGGGGEFGP